MNFEYTNQFNFFETIEYENALNQINYPNQKDCVLELAKKNRKNKHVTRCYKQCFTIEAQN